MTRVTHSLLIWIAGVAPVMADGPTWASITNAHQASVKALDTLSFRFQQSVDAFGRRTDYYAAYHRDGASTRIVEFNDRGDVIKEVERRGGRQRALVGFRDKASGSKYLSAVIAFDNEAITDLDGWDLALLNVPYCRKGISELIAEGSSIPAYRTVGEYRQPAFSFKVDGKVEYEVRLSPKANYLIDSVKLKTVRGEAGRDIPIVRHYHIHDFVELRPGVYFPAKCVSTHHEDGQLIATHTVVFSDFSESSRVSEPLRFPKGVMVTDRINGTYYRVDADDRPAGEVYKYNPVAVTAPADETVAPKPGTSLATWNALTYAAVGLILAGIVLKVRQRMVRA